MLSFPKDKPTRKEAKSRGIGIYWSEKKCPRGHDGWKYVSNSNCVSCMREAFSSWIAKTRWGVTDESKSMADARKKAEQLKEELELRRELEGL